MLHTFEDLIPLTTLPNIGKKAESLISLLQDSAPVPTGAVLSADAFKAFLQQTHLTKVYEQWRSGQISFEVFEAEIFSADLPTETLNQIESFLAQQPNTRWAVRSSGSKEDLQDASFAGLYTTVLNVKGLTDVIQAIKTCWLSLFGERVQAYVSKLGLNADDLELAVILQKMIPAEKSGVLFSVHPLKGHDTQILIEAVPGLGEALVSGHISADQYVWDWWESKLVEEQLQTQERCLLACEEAPFTKWQTLDSQTAAASVLTEAQIQDLAKIAIGIQQACGYPVDIEWVYANQQFYIVQRRAITKIFTHGIKGEWTTADFKDGGVSSNVCTPLMWSLYDYIWEATMPSYLAKTHLLASSESQTLWGDMFFARPYWNVGAVKAGLKYLPGFIEREFDMDLGIEVAYEGQGHVTPNHLKSILHGLKVLSALKKSFAARQTYNPHYAHKQGQRLAELRLIDLAKLSDADFGRSYQHLITQDYFLCESSYFYHIFDNSNITTLFKDSFKKYQSEINYLSLISGLQDLSHLRQNLELWQISRQIHQNSEALKLWLSTEIKDLMQDWAAEAPQLPMMSELQAYIQKFAYHSTRELDITVPRFGEDPSFVFISLKQLLSLPDTQDPHVLNQKQANEFELERQKLLKRVSGFKRKGMARSLEQLRSFLWWREELRDLSTQMYDQVRRWTLELGRRWQAAGRIQDVSDIFFLSVEQILAELEAKRDIDTDANTHLLPEIQRQKTYYLAFRNFRNPNEIGSRYQGTQKIQSGNVLTGIPSSPGMVTGIARVIQNIEDAERLQAGDILITRFTDPGWTPKFGLLAGVATETGGVLSHAAVISREYGIPAVLAIAGLTDRVRDGQMICLDGHNGQVTLIEKE